MSFEETLAALLEAKIAPLRQELASLRAEVCGSGRPGSGEYLSPKEAGELVGVNPATVRGWIAGGLRHYGRGRVLRVRRDELQAFLSDRQQGHDAKQTPEQEAVVLMSRRRRSRGG